MSANTARHGLLTSIASTIADYRLGAIPQPTADHVERWCRQFDPAAQDLLLAELDHVLRKTYVSKAEAGMFLRTLLEKQDLAGTDPCAFWKRANFLRIQKKGHSQLDMLAMFDLLLQESCGLETASCGSTDGDFVYLDDVVFTGNTVRNDVIAWITSHAPTRATLHIVVMAFHRAGQFYAQSGIQEACKLAGKSVNVRWWRSLEIEDRKSCTNTSDVLRPTSLPGDAASQAYVNALQYAPVMRVGASLGSAGFFATTTGREALEQELLKAGARIRSLCPNLNQYQRPLGNMILQSLGFGALVVTFRNCANNCPLAFWAGSPWYPLFPRRTN